MCYRVCFRWTDIGPEDVEIVVGKRAITADTDLRLCRYVGLSNGDLLRAQVARDTEVAGEALAKTLAKITPIARPEPLVVLHLAGRPRGSKHLSNPTHKSYAAAPERVPISPSILARLSFSSAIAASQCASVKPKAAFSASESSGAQPLLDSPRSAW